MADTDETAAPTGTSRPAAASTSSTATDASPPADPITALGECILAELGDPRTNNTLTRWLAHHTARLIDCADQAAATGDPEADDRASQARAAVLELWDHRSAWPNGWPPARTAKLVRLLDDLPEIDDPGWGQHNALGHLQLLHHHVLAALTDLAIAATDDVDSGWLATYGDRLSPDEVTLLTRAASAPRRLTSRIETAKPMAFPRLRPAACQPDAARTADAAKSDDADNADRDGGTTTGADVAEPRNPIVELAESYRETALDLFRRTTVGEVDTTEGDGPV